MSKITLRRAAKLRNKVEERLAVIRQELTQGTTVSVFITETDIAGIIAKASTEFSQLYARHSALSALAYELRSRIGITNATSGVNAGLTRIAALNSQRDLVRKLIAVVKPTLSLEQAQARLELAREQSKTADRYSRTNEIVLDVMPQETINSLKALEVSLSRDLDATHDAVEKLNSSVEIELTEADQALLSAEGLI